MEINLVSFCNQNISFFKAQILERLNSQNKKILIIAIAIIGWFAICFACFRYLQGLKAKKIDMLKKENPPPSSSDKTEPNNNKKPVQSVPEKSLKPKTKEEILSHHLSFLDPKDREKLSVTDDTVQYLSQSLLDKNSFIAILLKDEKCSLEIKLRLAKQVTDPNQVKVLYLVDSTIDNEQLKEFFQACPKIRHLNLSGSKQLTDDALLHLGQDLENLNLSNCKGLKKVLLHHLPKLKSLDLSFEWGSQLLVVDLNLPKLNDLNLGGCSKLTDLTLNHLDHLLSLNLSICRELKPMNLSQLTPHLSFLNVYGCTQFPLSFLEDLPGSVIELDISFCKQYNMTKDETINVITKLAKDLKLLMIGFNQIHSNYFDLTSNQIGKIKQDFLTKMYKIIDEKTKNQNLKIIIEDPS